MVAKEARGLGAGDGGGGYQSLKYLTGSPEELVFYDSNRNMSVPSTWS